MSVMAFHEKASRSQVISFIFSLDKVFSSAESRLLSPPFHPHSSLSGYVRSLAGSWARPLTPSPELGAWAFVFPT